MEKFGPEKAKLYWQANQEAVTALGKLAQSIDCDFQFQNSYESLFSPQRSMMHKQLFVNGLEATANLLLPTKPRCPHLGCALHWNAAEHSWDCSCHGSRFDEKGRVLNNPATDDMKHPPC